MATNDWGGLIEASSQPHEGHGNNNQEQPAVTGTNNWFGGGGGGGDGDATWGNSGNNNDNGGGGGGKVTWGNTGNNNDNGGGGGGNVTWGNTGNNNNSGGGGWGAGDDAGGGWNAGDGAGGGWNAGDGAGGGEWWAAANQPSDWVAKQNELMTRVPQSSQTRERVLTLADLVKTIVNGNPSLNGNPSHTLWYAATDLAKNLVGEDARDKTKDLGSGGAALEVADRALYSTLRPASQRIHWTLSPSKDDRVASLLDWIQVMSYALGTLGLQNFLVTRQRGMLISNAEYRNPKNQMYPAFDWLTFDDVVQTRDQILQESIASYKPEFETLVFVFLLSERGNSMAMWRRKLCVPNAVHKQNSAEIAALMESIAKRKHVIAVDKSPRKKKRWFNIHWS